MPQSSGVRLRQGFGLSLVLQSSLERNYATAHMDSKTAVSLTVTLIRLTDKAVD